MYAGLCWVFFMTSAAAQITSAPDTPWAHAIPSADLPPWDIPLSPSARPEGPHPSAARKLATLSGWG